MYIKYCTVNKILIAQNGHSSSDKRFWYELIVA